MTDTTPETPMELTAPIYTVGDLLDRLEAYREMHEAAGFEPESFRAVEFRVAIMVTRTFEYAVPLADPALMEGDEDGESLVLFADWPQ